MNLTPPSLSRRARLVAVLTLAVGGLALASFPGGAHAGAGQAAAPEVVESVESPAAVGDAVDPSTPTSEMGTGKAALLGVIEGITEYLPISSTGHLVVAERLLDLPAKPADKQALDAYTVIIQFGAIIAVLILYRKRVLQVLQGLIGKSDTGRQLLYCLVAAFIPAAAFGLALGDKIDEHLLKPGPVAGAWIVGGLVILALYKRLSPKHTGGSALEGMTVKTAFFIGCAQALALWPGTSRSLVTIVAAVLLGMSLAAAVEFSFLLGLITLTAATALSVAKDGSTVIDTYGKTAPLIGIIAAFIFALLAVKTFVTFLNRRDLKGFGIYRIAAGVVTLILMATTTKL